MRTELSMTRGLMGIAKVDDRKPPLNTFLPTYALSASTCRESDLDRLITPGISQ